MATRKALVLVSGLFQELNSSSDKLDFAGNTTADLTENTNLYYTNARSRAAVSVTDSGGDGSLAYNNSTGVITYVGPSAAEARAHLSVASGSGLTYCVKFLHDMFRCVVHMDCLNRMFFHGHMYAIKLHAMVFNSTTNIIIITIYY